MVTHYVVSLLGGFVFGVDAGWRGQWMVSCYLAALRFMWQWRWLGTELGHDLSSRCQRSSVPIGCLCLLPTTRQSCVPGGMAVTMTPEGWFQGRHSLVDALD